MNPSRSGELVVEILNASSPVPTPRCPIYSTAHNKTVVRLIDRGRATANAGIKSGKSGMFPGNTGGSKKQDIGLHSITETSADAANPVQVMRPVYATGPDRCSVE